MAEITCVRCGIKFSVPDDWDAKRRCEGSTFYCPNGHSLYFPQTQVSREEQLQQEVESLRREVDRYRGLAKYHRDQFNGLKGYVKRLELKLARGVRVCEECGHEHEIE